MKGFVIWWILAGVVIVGTVGYVWITTHNVPVDTVPIKSICTQDAKQCPDGSYVGRTGPKCEFVCPGDNASSSAVIAGWKTYLNNDYKFSFKYPSDWEEKEITNGVSLKKVLNIHTAPFPSQQGVEVLIYPGKGNLTGKQYLEQIFYEGRTDALTEHYINVNDKIEKISVGGEQVDRITELSQPVGSEGWGVWIPDGKDGLFLHFFLSSEPEGNTQYSQLLDSFRFSQ